MANGDDEVALAARWQQHRDEAAAETLWRRHQRLAVAVAAKVLEGCPAPIQEGQEICDDSFIKALQTFQPSRAAGRSPFRNWLLSIVRNAAIDRRRKLVRLVYPPEPPDTGDDPQQWLAMAIDVRAMLPQLRRFILEHYLPSDLMVFERWVQLRRAGEPVPWKALAAQHPITLDEIVPFPAHTAELIDTTAIESARRALSLSPQLQIRVTAHTAPAEDTRLAGQRLEAVLAHLRRDLRPAIRRDGTERLLSAQRHDDAPGRAELEVCAGGHYSGDGLRMRIEKVILPHAISALKLSPEAP